MSRVLVTGASGFIGSHLVESLVARGDEVCCLVRPSSRVEVLRSLGVELVAGDFERPQEFARAVAGVDVVFHLAGVIRTFSSRQFMSVNCQGTARLAEACAAQSQPPRLVLVSSVAAAGPAGRGQERIELDSPAPVSNYGRSKLAGEQAAVRFASQIPLSIVRPGIVIGPRDTMFVKVLQTIRWLRIHLSPGLDSPPLSFIHVADLVELLLRVADRGSRVPVSENGHPRRGIYFAATAEHPTYAELGHLVGPMLNRPRMRVVRVPSPIVWCVAGMNECITRLRGRPHELNFDKIREALAPSWACSGELARRELGFTPVKTLADRLRETIDWYRARGWI